MAYTAQLELLKVYGVLRNDDMNWSPLKDLEQAGAPGFMYGSAYKTKATEMTATRQREAMPWVAPRRGVTAGTVA